VKERLIQYRDKAVHYWNQTNKTQKIGFISGVVLLLLVIGITAVMLSRTEYSNAFQDLDASDAAAITTYLQEQGIDYKISTDGKTIGVPTTVVAEVKIAVESQGLVQNGSIGYGIFKENISSFGMTDNEFNVLKADAISGEIQQLINGMNGVERSKVVLYVPQDNVFVSEAPEQSSAAVLIWFKRGVRPDQNMVDTIYNLVSHSLPKMSIENITISDQEGELLPSTKIGGGLNSSTTVVSQQFMIKKQFENEIQRNIQSMLNKIFPPEKVVVSVVSSLNFDKKNSIEQLVKPVNEVDQKGIEISVETIQETYSSEGGNSSGVAGTGETDIPGYPTASQSGSTESESLTERINFDVNRISNEIQSSPYQVKDLTINVALEPPIKNDPASLTEDTKDAIQQILKNVVAASLADSGRTYTNEELDNKVFVLAHSFDGVDNTTNPTFITSGLFYGLAAIALAIIIIGSLIVFRRRKQAVLQEEELAMQLSKPDTPSIDLESIANESQVKKQLESLAKKKPEEFVNLLRTWLVDE
jgi:flagellar M-ring protein FliF